VYILGRHCVMVSCVIGVMAVLPLPSRAGPAVVSLSTPLQIEVSGDPAPISVLRRAIRIAAHSAFPELQDAEIALAATRPTLTALPSGRSMHVRADLAVMTPGTGTIVWVVSVTLVNVTVPWHDAQQLFVSDSPETVDTDGILYSGIIRGGRAARILYHHQNAKATRDMWLSLGLTNTSPDPVQVCIFGATGGPAADELFAGHFAARGFLEQYQARAGIVVNVPPAGFVPILATKVPPDQVASGLAQIAVLRGSGVQVQLEAQFPRIGEPPVFSRVLPMDTQHQRGVFGAPLVQRNLSYTVAGPVAQLWLGADQDLLRDEMNGAPLQGNYGVVYSFDVRLTNPGPDPRVVALIVHANGGPAAAAIVVNGTLEDLAMVQPDAPQPAATLRIPAASSVDAHISTMSEAGSYYPLLMTVGPP